MPMANPTPTVVVHRRRWPTRAPSRSNWAFPFTTSTRSPSLSSAWWTPGRRPTPKPAPPTPASTATAPSASGFLMQRALALGADYLATGHYARVDDGRPTTDHCVVTVVGGRSSVVYRLLKGPRRPQGPELCAAWCWGKRTWRGQCFPCGEFVKDECGRWRASLVCPRRERAESQDLCFLTQGDYRGFLVRNAPHAAIPGPIVG